MSALLNIKGPFEDHEIILRFYKQIDVSFLSILKGPLEDQKRGMLAMVRGELKPGRLKTIVHCEQRVGVKLCDHQNEDNLIYIALIMVLTLFQGLYINYFNPQYNHRKGVLFLS